MQNRDTKKKKEISLNVDVSRREQQITRYPGNSLGAHLAGLRVSKLWASAHGESHIMIPHLFFRNGVGATMLTSC